jgi:catalase
MNFNRDGAMRHRISKGQVNYWPNRFEAGPPIPHAKNPSVQAFTDPPMPITGNNKSRFRGDKFAEHHSQAQLFLNSLTPIEKQHLVNAIGFELSHCDDPLVYERAIPRLVDIDPELAKAVAEKVANGRYSGPDDKELATLISKTNHPNHGRKTIRVSNFDFIPAVPTIKSRRIAILIADGYDATVVSLMKATLSAAGAVPMIIGPRRNVIYPAGGSTGLLSGKKEGIRADHHFEGQRSTLFDAILIPPGKESVASLSKNGRAIHWVREAFGHLKAIGAVGEAVDFVREAVRLPIVHYATADGGAEVVNSYGVITAAAIDTSDADSVMAEVEKPFKIAKEAADFMGKFMYAVSMHRCWERELDGLVEMVAF